MIAQPREKVVQGGPNHSPPTLKRLLWRRGSSSQGCTLTWQEAVVTSCSRGNTVLIQEKKKHVVRTIKCQNRLPKQLLEYPSWEMPKICFDGALNNLIPAFNRKLHHGVSRVPFQPRLSSDFMILCFNDGAFIQGRRRGETRLGVY